MFNLVFHVTKGFTVFYASKSWLTWAVCFLRMIITIHPLYNDLLSVFLKSFRIRKEFFWEPGVYCNSFSVKHGSVWDLTVKH